MLWLTFSLREERELERKFSFTFIVVGFLLLFYPGSQSTICEIGTRAEGTLLKWLLRKCMCLNHLLLFPPSIFLLLLNFSSPREEWSMKQVNDANVDVGRKEKNKTGTNNSQDIAQSSLFVYEGLVLCRWSSSFCFFFLLLSCSENLEHVTDTCQDDGEETKKTKKIMERFVRESFDIEDSLFLNVYYNCINIQD